MARSSKELIEKLGLSADIMKGVIRDDNRPPHIQIADISTICWAVVQLAFEIQRAVDEEMRDLKE